MRLNLGELDPFTHGCVSVVDLTSDRLGKAALLNFANGLLLAHSSQPYQVFMHEGNPPHEAERLAVF